MAKVTFMVPYPEICEDVQTVFTEQNDGEWDIELISVDGAPHLIRYDKIRTDIVVARGLSAFIAQEYLGAVPVIRLPVSGYDVIKAVLECRTMYHPGRIAIVGSEDMVYGARSVQEITGIETITSIANSEDETERNLIRLKKDGIEVICGGLVTTRIAAALGLQAVFIKSGREAIYQALLEAKRVYCIRRQEQERSEQFRTIIDYSIEGIVAVNNQGQVNLINAAALKITGLAGELDGQLVDAILPELRLGRVLSTGNAEIGEIKMIGNQQVIINSAPITVNDLTVGAIATFQPVVNIQELEGKIRQKMYHRGHVAKLSFSDILGNSDIIKRTIEVAKEYSKVDSNVLIVGETGTGKEVFAQSIHKASDRASGPFVAFNCAALPENLMESELFGYVGGAFTGAAKEGKAGLFELAHNGTIFLDEVSEISIQMQGRLLRVLQEREIMRLGDCRIIPIDVRVIAATNRNLGKMVKGGTFRADLYYRLDILKLFVPPLRERKGDALQLLSYFLRVYCRRFSKPGKKISPDAQKLLDRYSWPGNVRELMNIAERLAVIIRSVVIDEADIYAAFYRESDIQPVSLDENQRQSQSPLLKQPGHAKRKLSQTVLLQALQESGYHYSQTAARLGISRTTLWKWLKELEIEQIEQNEQN